MEIKPVKQRHDKIIIVASGSSLKGFDLSLLEQLKDIKTISVNGAYWYFKPDYFCSIDPTTQAMVDILKHKSNCYKYIGFKEPVGNCHYLKRFLNNSKDKATKDNCLLCEDKREIQSHNSAYAAFNLAYHMEPKKVLLLGIDADNSPHFYDDISYPVGSKGWDISISKIPTLFEIALPQIEKRGIEVLNGSLQSRVECFPKVSIEEGLKWIQQ